MADNDMLVFKDANDAVFDLAKAYRAAINASDLAAVAALKPKFEEANSVYSQARLKLLEAGVIATDADVEEMERIKTDIDDAATTQQFVDGAIQLIAALRRLL